MQSVENAPTLKPGQRLACPVCDTELIVIRAPSHGVPLACGGAVLADIAAPRSGGEHADGGGEVVQLGKRYVDGQTSLELLCTKPGSGALTCRGEPLSIKAARPLPSSD